MTTPELILGVTEDGATGRLQVHISRIAENGAGYGYRLAGPKFNGTGRTLLRKALTAADAQEIRRYLDAAFPPGQEA